MLATAKRIVQAIEQLGVDGTTPPHLVDRVVFCNWVCIIGTIVNLLGLQANLTKGYHLLLALNGVYQAAIFACWALNRRRHYLAARLTLLSAIYGGLTIACAVQGPVVQMEHFYLAFAVLAFSLFHPSERRWTWLFGLVTVVAFLFFVSRATPLVALDPARGRYSTGDLTVNQISYMLLLIGSLMALSNAYARAVRVVDEQRARQFEQSRLASVGAMACNIAHEINSPLAALDIKVYTLLSALKQKGESEAKDTLRLVEQIHQLSGRIASVVREYRLISSFERGEPSEPIRLGELIQPVLDLYEDRLRRLGIDMRVRLHDRQHLLRGQTVALSQVLLNLIDNAVDAVSELPKEKRWIQIESSSEQGRCRISISDAGMIGPDVRSRIFEPFFTTKPTARGPASGSWSPARRWSRTEGR